MIKFEWGKCKSQKYK